MLITRAAIMYEDGETFEGHSYSSVTNMAHKLGFHGEFIRGFMTSSDEFVLPDEAAKIAYEAHQISKEKDVLEPDDLFPHVLDD